MWLLLTRYEHDQSGQWVTLLLSTFFKWPFFHKGRIILSDFYTFTANSTEGRAFSFPMYLKAVNLYAISSILGPSNGCNLLKPRLRHLIVPFCIMMFMKCESCTWNGFYGSLNLRQIGLRNYSLQSSSSPDFWPCSSLFLVFFEVNDIFGRVFLSSERFSWWGSFLVSFFFGRICS